MFRIYRMGYSLPDTTVPRMSSKNHKVFTIFLRFFPIKPLFSYRGRFIKVTKIQGWTLYKCYRLSIRFCKFSFPFSSWVLVEANWSRVISPFRYSSYPWRFWVFICSNRFSHSAFSLLKKWICVILYSRMLISYGREATMQNPVPDERYSVADEAILGAFLNF